MGQERRKTSSGCRKDFECVREIRGKLSSSIILPIVVTFFFNSSTPQRRKTSATRPGFDSHLCTSRNFVRPNISGGDRPFEFRPRERSSFLPARRDGDTEP
ncbi:unnamed protein product [Trichogramma brassicae]|uniref:Uncharacterized protein n=1 Tax=Trichogramma brassicae TaxID=86971 RepID=A0A6H5J1X1_9HYME|nr:unnamed protein product [Trichogramma brassicae]